MLRNITSGGNVGEVGSDNTSHSVWRYATEGKCLETYLQGVVLSDSVWRYATEGKCLETYLQGVVLSYSVWRYATEGKCIETCLWRHDIEGNIEDRVYSGLLVVGWGSKREVSRFEGPYTDKTDSILN